MKNRILYSLVPLKIWIFLRYFPEKLGGVEF